MEVKKFSEYRINESVKFIDEIMRWVYIDGVSMVELPESVEKFKVFSEIQYYMEKTLIEKIRDIYNVDNIEIK